MSREEAHFWRERYQTLFERNIAGVILTSAAGQIIDCNEPCARIFGSTHGMRCSTIRRGISISTGRSVKDFSMNFTHNGIARWKKFACGTGVAGRFGYWQRAQS